MKRFQSLALLCVLTVSLPLAAGTPEVQSPSATIPDQVAPVVSGREAPEWVSAESATQEGELRRELFAQEDLPVLEMSLESGRRALESYRAAAPSERPADPCAYIAVSDHRIPPPARTLEGLVAESSRIYVGTVTAERPGLLRGIPRALFRVEIEKVVKHEAPAPPPASALVSYADVKIDIAGVCLAAKNGRSPARPAIGRRVLLFSGAKGAVGETPLLAVADEEIFFETMEGEASLPSHFGDLLLATGEPITLDFVIDQVKELSARTGRGPT